jgi:hypothetical protein
MVNERAAGSRVGERTSCRGKTMHALSKCDCSKACYYAALVETERSWFELLMRLARHRVDHPERGESRVIALMLWTQRAG